MLTQADWIPNSEARRGLFAFVARTLNAEVGADEFVPEDGPTGPLLRHLPSNLAVGIRPSLPANPKKPFDLWLLLTHRFPVRSDGSFNAPLLVKRIKEVQAKRLDRTLRDL